MVGAPSMTSPTPIDPLWRFSVEQYHAMIGSGIIPSGSPVELIEGILVQKMAKSPSHRITTRSVRRALEVITPPGWYVDEQEPVTLSDSEPEPDVMIVRGDSADYPDRHPSAADVELVIEISAASLSRDRGMKQRVYARAGIPTYWILDLNAGRVEVRTQPDGEQYRVATVFSRSDVIPVLIAGVHVGEVPVANLLPGH